MAGATPNRRRKESDGSDAPQIGSEAPGLVGRAGSRCLLGRLDEIRVNHAEAPDVLQGLLLARGNHDGP
jgi:hypothetical protein